MSRSGYYLWLGSGYYLGLDDDQDLGVVWQYQAKQHRWHVGLFSGDEYGDASREARYSSDIASTPTLPYREREQFNLRYEYTGGADDSGWKMGAFLESFEITAAHVPSLNVAWTFQNPGWFDAITCYNDYSETRASGPGLRNSQMNVTGCYLPKITRRFISTGLPVAICGISMVPASALMNWALIAGIHG